MTFAAAFRCPTLRVMTYSACRLRALTALPVAVLAVSLASCSSGASTGSSGSSAATVTITDCHPLPSLPGPQTWDLELTLLNNTDATRSFTITWQATHDQQVTGAINALPAHNQKDSSLVVRIAVAPGGTSEPVSCSPSSVTAN